MDIIKDNEDPSDDYWKDYDNENGIDENSSFRSNKVLNGISIKDLCDGKEIMFETGGGLTENDFDAEDDICNEVTHCDMKSLRENRGAPPLSCSFKEMSSRMTNLTEDGFVKKQVIRSGVGKVVPDNAFVTVHYNLYKENCDLPFDSTYLRNRPEKLKLDQGEAFLGLECAIKSMKKNENSIFFIQWQMAFGAMGCPDRIGKKCDIVADVTLVNFMEIQPGEGLDGLSGDDLSSAAFQRFINEAKKFLCSGSDEFSKGDVKAALSNYKKAMNILNNIRLADKEQESTMFKQKVKCLVNLAICYNKLGKHELACLACQEALSIDSKSVKAHFHYGRANIALSNFALARKYLLNANRLKPNDRDINMEIKKLNDKKALYEMQDKVFWKKALVGDSEKGNSQTEPSALENFEKQLLSSLQESLKEDKSYALPMPITESELEICGRVASKLNIEFETHPQFYLFKRKKKPDGA